MALDSVNRLKAYNQAFRGLRELEPDTERQAKYLEFIDIYAALDENERQQYEREYPEDHNAMVGIVTRAREEGIQQGIQKGMQQGKAAALTSKVKPCS